MTAAERLTATLNGMNNQQQTQKQNEELKAVDRLTAALNTLDTQPVQQMQPIQTTPNPAAAIPSIEAQAVAINEAARNNAQRKAAHQQAMEALKTETPTFFERVGKIVSGGIKQSVGSTMDAIGLPIEAADAQAQREVQKYVGEEAAQIAAALPELEAALAAETDPAKRAKMQADIDRLRAQLEKDNARLNDTSITYGENLRNKAMEVTQSGAADIERAKEGAGKLGQFAVDVGTAGTQMLGDIATGAPMLSMMVRSFGGASQNAKAKGYDLKQQTALGLASAATEYFSEKLFGGNPVYDSDVGLVNKLVGEVTSNENILKALDSLPADLLSEGLEEVVAGVLEPLAEGVIAGNWEKLDIAQLGKDAAVGIALAGLGIGGNKAANAVTGRGQVNTQPATTQADTAALNAQSMLETIDEVMNGKTEQAESVNENVDNVDNVDVDVNADAEFLADYQLTEAEKAAVREARGESSVKSGLEQRQKEGYTDSNITQEDAYNGTEVHLRNSGERNRGTDTGRTVSSVEKSTRRAERGQATGRPADHETASLAYGEKVSTKSLGIANGTENANIRLIAYGETSSMREAKKVAEERGLTLTFFAGDNLSILQDDGSVASVRGYIEGNRVFVRVDHSKYTSDQLMRHEAGHDMIDKGEINPDTVRERIEKVAGAEQTARFAQRYAEAYSGTNLTPDEIWVEVMCDSLGDMNIFANQNSAEVIADMLDVARTAIGDTKTENTRAPPVERKAKYSSEYWYPKLTNAEWNLLNHRMEMEVGYSNKYLDEETKWLYATEKGVNVFAVYGIGDGAEPTPLYASGAKTAPKDYTRFKSILEEHNNGSDASREELNRWLETELLTKGKNRSNSHASKRGRAATGNVAIRSGKRAGDTGRLGENSAGNSGKVTPHRSQELDIEKAPVFYSKMEREIEASKQNKFGAASVVSMLRGKGVKSEEIKWSGIEQFLEGKKSVTKEELLEFIQNNQLEIEEQELSEGVKLNDEQLERMEELEDEAERLWDEAHDLWHQVFDASIPADFMLSGNKSDYVERKLNNGGLWRQDGAHELYSIAKQLEMNDYWHDYVLDEARMESGEAAKWGEYKLDGGDNYREYLFKMPGSDYSNQAMKAHWNNNTGVLAHARVQDFTHDDKPVLFIEEIQSDWHNAGQKYGYGDKDAQIRQLEKEQEDVLSDLATMQEVLDDYHKRLEQGEYIEDYYEVYDLYTELNRKYENYNRDIRRVKHGDAAVAPDAPYSKTYHEFVLKNLLRKAAEGGYSYLAWTPGELQEERWSSDYAEGYRIEYDQDIPKFLNKYGKQWGAHTEDISLDGLRNVSVHAIPITEAMRQSVLYEGQPRYSQEVEAEQELDGEEAESIGKMQDIVRSTIREELDRMGKKYGWIEAGEKPTREVKLPQRTADDKKLSQTVRTVMEAEATPNEALPTIEAMVASGDFSYEEYGDEQAVSEAREYISRVGWEKARDNWAADVKNGVVSKRNTATGWLLYNNAVNSGNIELAMNILDAMIGHQRNAAQALQATRILKKLRPETQLYGVQRSIANMQEELNERYKGKRGNVELKINEELAKRFTEAETQEERDEILKEIYRDIGRQLPSTLSDKFRAWRYLAMLGNARTHVRNIAGNAFFAPVVLSKDLTATAIEKIAYKASKGKMKRSKSFVGLGKNGKELLAAAMDDYSNVADMVTGEGKYDDLANANRYIEEGRRVFKPEALEAARRGNSAAMETEDVWFSKPHYAYALAQYCRANDISAEQIRSGKGISLAREYAAKEAQKATYRDLNQFSEWVSKLGKNYTGKNAVAKTINTAVEAILPFKKTPANIFARAVEYSPIELAKALTFDLRKVQKGEMMAAEMIDHLSSGLVGTALVGMGALFRHLGIVSGGEDDEEAQAFKELIGEQNYALLTAVKNYTLDWLAPEILSFFVGVELYDSITDKDPDGDLLTNVLDAVSNISEPMLELSMLSGVEDMLSTVRYSEGKTVPKLIKAIVTSYLSQFIPTLGGQIERTFLEEQRETTFVDRNSKLSSDTQYTIGKVANKIPFVEYSQIPYIDAWGRTEESGNMLERGFENMIAPWYVSNHSGTPADEELQRLFEAGYNNVYPERVSQSEKIDNEYLTAEEYVSYAKSVGQKSLELVQSLQESESYKLLTDEDKAEAVSDVYSWAKKLAKEEIREQRGAESQLSDAEKTQSELESEDYANYLIFKNAYYDAQDNKGDESLDELLDGFNKQSKEVIDTLMEVAGFKNVASAHDAGIDSEIYYDLKDMQKGIDNVNDWAAAIDQGKGAASGLTGKQKEWAKDNFTYGNWIPTPAGESRYTSLAEEYGLSSEMAQNVVHTIDAIEPPEGKDSAQLWQKYDAIADMDATDQEKLKAIKAYTSTDKAYEKIVLAVANGCTLKQVAAYKRLQNAFSKVSEQDAYYDLLGLTQSEYNKLKSYLK